MIDSEVVAPQHNAHARLEGLKWLALAAMLIDHGTKIVFYGWMWEGHLVGRLAWPLFALIVAERVAISPGLWERYLRRLLPWALVAQPAFMGVSGTSQLNVLWSLVAGVALCQPRRQPALALGGLVLAPFCEFGPVGPLSVPLLVAAHRRWGRAVAVLLCGPLALLANFPTDYPLHALPALLATPVAAVAALPAPRLPGPVYYLIYPAHLYALWGWYVWVI